MLNIFWRHLTGRDGGAADFASFTRKFVADTAEVVEQHAGTVKEKMRGTESEVQQGNRDPVTGLQRPKEEPRDTRGTFEARMDTAKVAGSEAIGAGQQVQQSRAELSQKTSRNLESLLDDVRVSIYPSLLPILTSCYRFYPVLKKIPNIKTASLMYSISSQSGSTGPSITWIGLQLMR